MAEHLVTLLVRHDETSDPQAWDWSAKLGCREVSVIASAALPPLLELDPLAVPDHLLSAPAEPSAQEPEFFLAEGVGVLENEEVLEVGAEVEDDGFGTPGMAALSPEPEETDELEGDALALSPVEDEGISLETPGFGEEELGLALQSLELNSYEGEETAEQALEVSPEPESALEETSALELEDMDLGFGDIAGGDTQEHAPVVEGSELEAEQMEGFGLAPAMETESTLSPAYGSDELGVESYGLDEAAAGTEPVAAEESVSFEDFEVPAEESFESFAAPVEAAGEESAEVAPITESFESFESFEAAPAEESFTSFESMSEAPAEAAGEEDALGGLDLGDLDLDETATAPAADPTLDELDLGDLDLGDEDSPAATESTPATGGFEDMDDLDEGMGWNQLGGEAEVETPVEAEAVEVPIDQMSEDDRRAAAYNLFEGLWTQVCAAAQPHHFILLSHFSELTPPQMLDRLSSTLDQEGRVPTPIDQTEAWQIAERIRELDPETYPRM